MATCIHVENLSHTYDGRPASRPALDRVSFQVAEGEIFGFLGPNGGGKTTLFRVLSTALTPSHPGIVEICGVRLFQSPHQVRQKLGVVFQEPSLDKKLTIEENLKHQGHLFGLWGKNLRERIDALLKWVGLGERKHERVETLSGGLKRRAEIAKALLHDPKVLLLDEPTTGLDPGGRIDIWNYLRKLKEEQGVTCLFTTHLMEEGERCDRLGILHRGALVALGTPAALKEAIGGEILTLQVSNVFELKAAIRRQFDIDPMIVDGRLRMEVENADALMLKLKEAYPNEIDAVTVGRPTLEDVFIRKTGHQFWEGK